MIHLARPLVVLDIETTGFSGRDNRLLEVAFAVYEGTFSPAGRVREHDALVCPGCDVPERITLLTGIATADVEGAEPEADALARLATLLEGADVAAYNGRTFDVPFLAACMLRHGLALPNVFVHDPLVAFRRDKPGRKEHRLGDAAAFYGVAPGRAHRALGDVHTTEAVMARQFDAWLGRLHGPSAPHRPHPPTALARFWDAPTATATA